MKPPSTAPRVSESLLRLHGIAVRLRLGTFVLALVTAAYVRQVGLSDSVTLVRLFAVAGSLGAASALDECLLRGARRWGPWALYGIAFGDWLVASFVLWLAPNAVIDYPFIYLIPVIVASSSLGISGGLSMGILCALSLGIQAGYNFGSASFSSLLPWVVAYLATGGIGGYVGQQWETAQRHVEATYRWVSDLSAAGTLDEVAEVILRYLESFIQIKVKGAGAQSHNGPVALLTQAEGEGLFSAYAAKGISPEARARLRVSTRDGLLSWSTMGGRSIWIGLGQKSSPMALPHLAELEGFKSCLVVPINHERKVVALGCALTTKVVSQGETEEWSVGQFARQAGASLRKAMTYAQMEREVKSFASLLERIHVGGQDDAKEVFRWIVANVRELCEVKTVAIGLRDRDGNLVVASTFGNAAEALLLRAGSSGGSPCDWVIDHKAHVLIDDYPSDVRFSTHGDRSRAFRSAVLVPLKTLDEVFGVLAAGSCEKSSFSESDLMIFVMLGQQVSQVLEQSRLQVDNQRLRGLMGRRAESGTCDTQRGLHMTQSAKFKSQVEAKINGFEALSEPDQLYEQRSAILAEELGKVFQSPLGELGDAQAAADVGNIPDKNMGAVSQELLRLSELVQRQQRELKLASNQGDLYKRQWLVFADELGTLHRLIEGLENQIHEATQEADEAQDSIVKALAMSLERNHQFLAGSGERVANLAAAIADLLRCSPDEQIELYRAALVRDIGLMGVPPEILLLPFLDEEQTALVRRHSETACTMLGPFPLLLSVAAIVRHHHERWDGRGYPDGLAGETIPLCVRILAVADVYDALTSQRRYRGSFSPREALETVLNNAGSQFDPNVCNALAAVLDERRDIASLVLPGLSARD